jgi:hypothetical protein
MQTLNPCSIILGSSEKFIPELSEHGEHKMRFSVPPHFQSLKAIKNGGASVRRRNTGLIRVSFIVAYLMPIVATALVILRSAIGISHVRWGKKVRLPVRLTRRNENG